ncbi:MAG TPA: chloride channel protein [Polyangiaceae bacterium]|nr:chloride channel protein [Polyangiaceae bacterium]
MQPSTRPRPWRESRPELLIHNTVTDRLFRNERLLLLWAAIIVGACGGGFALGVRLLIDMNWWAFSYLRSLDRPLFVLLVLAIPALGGLVLGLIARISMAVGEPGVEELRKSFLTTVGILAVPTALLRLLACAVTMTMGGSVGAEGPVARASTALGSWFARRFGLDDSRAQLLIACGVSASIAGIFHTPFAAVVFAAEVVLGVYAIRRLAYLLLAAGVSLGLSRWGAGLDAPFSAPPFVLQSPLDLVIHAVVGTGCGALAVLLLKATEWLVSMRDRCAGVWPSVLGGLMVGGVVLMVPQAVGVGYPALSGLLSNSVTISFVVAVLVAKLTATALTLGSRGVGGVFSPSLVVGGASVGWWAVPFTVSLLRRLLQPHRMRRLGWSRWRRRWCMLPSPPRHLSLKLHVVTTLSFLGWWQGWPPRSCRRRFVMSRFPAIVQGFQRKVRCNRRSS